MGIEDGDLSISRISRIGSADFRPKSIKDRYDLPPRHLRNVTARFDITECKILVARPNVRNELI
jgi:hypothetical protein